MVSKVGPELKTAIMELPEKEKDKLLLRLIRKDSTLIQQLHFQLLEDEYDLEDRRIRTKKLIDMELRMMDSPIDVPNYYNYRRVLLELRTMSGHVNHYALITKDKVGELGLRIQILIGAFQNIAPLLKYNNYSNERILLYIVGRIKNIFVTFEKLHEDLQYDYKEDFNQILAFAYKSALKTYLQELGIPEEC